MGTRDFFLAQPLRWYEQFWLPLFVYPAPHQLLLAAALRRRQHTRSRGCGSGDAAAAADAAVPLTELPPFPPYRRNAGHIAVAAVAAVCPAVRVVTQNIDGLHRLDHAQDTGGGGDGGAMSISGGDFFDGHARGVCAEALVEVRWLLLYFAARACCALLFIASLLHVMSPPLIGLTALL